jgi:hypothetical protein
MALFQKYSFDDNKLPIQAWSGDQFKDNPKKGILHLFVSMEGRWKNGYGKIWTLRKIKGFQEHQWKFLAPVISTAEPNHNLGELTVPFIKKHAKFDEGSFGVVSKYEIHGDHIIDPSRPVRHGICSCPSSNLTLTPSRMTHPTKPSLSKKSRLTIRRTVRMWQGTGRQR